MGGRESKRLEREYLYKLSPRRRGEEERDEAYYANLESVENWDP